ncbi:hypothetical protein F5141DRAFT_1102538 [Pisolithus sp. B1]|nr:hypothetical protein F5141DRAFT_1102538 [Pisolithus sp. B1]
MNPLTTGICSRLGNAPLSEVEAIDAGFTVQLRSIKRIVRALDRYWVTISDGDSFIQATLARRLHDLVTDEKVTTKTVIAIDNFTCTRIRGKRVFIILDMHVVSQTEERIGNPVPASSLAQVPAREALPVDAFDHKCVPGFPAAGDAQGRLTSPIGCINPFMRNWTIRARVIGKTEVRHYDWGRGGKVFRATLMDESQEIGAIGFDGAVDTIYDKLDKGSVYYISQAHITEVTDKFRANGIQNKYQLKLEKDTKVEECLEPTSIPIVRYRFIPIASLEELRTGSFCDVLTILKDVGPLRRRRVCVAAGNGININRHVNVMDMSQHVVRITLWGDFAERFLAEKLSIIAWKTVKIDGFGVRSLSMTSYSVMTISPDIEEAYRLRQWYDAIGARSAFRNFPSTWVL